MLQQERTLTKPAACPHEQQPQACLCFNLRIEGSDITTITYVFEVKMSIKAAKLEFLTSMLWKEAASLLQREKRNMQCSVTVTALTSSPPHPQGPCSALETKKRCLQRGM